MSSRTLRVTRLRATDAAAAKQLFTMMGDVFEERRAPLGDAYVAMLLAREDLWVIAAFEGDEVVGGITAHVLPMTRTEAKELFIYDVAVRTDRQRTGIGRRMMAFVNDTAKAAGIGVTFVPADDEDTHAIEFYRSLGGTPAPVTMFTFED